MPYTPYHFGPAGLLGYIFRKWIDLPVFVLANVVIDIEVLVNNILHIGWPYHRFCHTLIGGSAVGLVWGVLAYFIAGILLKRTKIKYQPRFWKMAISGILGGQLHSVIDSFYHYDVKIFWPMQKNPFWNIISQSQVKELCLVCFAVLAILYIWSRLKKRQSV
jgi:membrane-bound metal-dependent hydrolase YbcI (DUF457 family)